MAMVGLFWIAQGDVYVGAKPSGLAPGVRLTPEGVVALGDGQSGLRLWEDVRALTVTDVPVKSLLRKIGAVKNLAVGTVMNLAVPMVTGPTEETPPLMTLRVASAGGDLDLLAYSAAAVGYPPVEVDLSRALLSRLTEGAGDDVHDARRDVGVGPHLGGRNPAGRGAGEAAPGVGGLTPGRFGDVKSEAAAGVPVAASPVSDRAATPGPARAGSSGRRSCPCPRRD